MMLRGSAVALGFLMLVLQRPLITHLQPQTLQEFAAYSQSVRKEFERANANTRAARPDPAMTGLTNGDILVEPHEGNPIAISNGLIHDWTGDMFIPHATPREVVSVLQDFDHHTQVYPSMTRSRLLRRRGNAVSGYWRMTRASGLVSITLDIYDDAEYKSLGPGKWLCEARTPKILQIDDPGAADEKALPDDVGYGFLWRFDAYWVIVASGDGVLVECRTLSLSRSIPPAVAWLIKPFVDSQPREALRSTLDSTRSAVQLRHPQ